jgi:hypothetical protein
MSALIGMLTVNDFDAEPVFRLIRPHFLNGRQSVSQSSLR